MEYKDTVNFIILTLDNVTENYLIIASVDGLPNDSFPLLEDSFLVPRLLVELSYQQPMR